MNKPVTKYLLLLPLGYLGYCFFEDYRLRLAREEMMSRRDPTNGLSHEYARFKKCKSTSELANILKKSLRHVRAHITEPRNGNPEVVDCEVIDSGDGSWLSSFYHTKTSLRFNKYSFEDNQKSGHYSLLFWTGLATRDRLRLDNTDEA
jgi:hypothetical protein